MKHADVIVVGAGPAGIAAATAAARHGRSVLLLDDNPAAGGQIWRGGIEARRHEHADKGENARKDTALNGLASSGATLLSGYRVFDAPAPANASRTPRNRRRCRGSRPSIRPSHPRHRSARAIPSLSRLDSSRSLWSRRSAGARQRRIPRPGQARRGRRLRPASAGRRRPSPASTERTSPASRSRRRVSQLAPFAASLWSHPGKDPAGHRLPRSAWQNPLPHRLLAGLRSLQTKQPGMLKSVRFTNGAKTWDEPCDLLACGFHLVPNTELASLLGCNLRGDFVASRRPAADLGGKYLLRRRTDRHCRTRRSSGAGRDRRTSLRRTTDRLSARPQRRRTKIRRTPGNRLSAAARTPSAGFTRTPSSAAARM